MPSAVGFNADGEDYSRAVSLGSAFTVVCWAKIAVDRNTWSTAWGLNAGTTQSTYLALQTQENGNVWSIYTEALDNVLLTATVGTWYAIGIVQNDTSGTAYYGTDPAALTSESYAATSVTRTTFRIGESPWGGEWLNGSVAAVKVFDSALTAQQVATELAQYAPVLPAYAAYQFDNGPSTADSSGNGRTLSGGSGTATDASGPPIPLTAGIAKTGSAVARGAGSGAKSITGLAKSGGGAARGAGSGAKIEARNRTASTTMATASSAASTKSAFSAVATAMDTASTGVGFKAYVIDSIETVMGLTAIAYVQAFGRDDPPPYLEIITAPFYPPARRGLRVIAQRIITGEWLDWNVPLKNIEITHNLSGPKMIKGVIGPESQDIRDIGLDPWGTWIHVEENDEIRASGILLPIEIPGEFLPIEAAGVSVYPQDMPWKGVLSEAQIDPAEVVRRIWTHLQSYPEGALNTTVSSTTTPVRLGESGTSQSDQDRTNAAKAILARIQSGEPYFEDWTWQGSPQIVQDWNDPLLDEYEKVGGDAAAWLQTFIDEHPIVEAKPYELNWWEAPDCGSEIDSLARSTPFDFLEVDSWNAAKTIVNHRIEIGYPRIGKRLIGQSAPRFVQGENATQMFVLGETPDLYASEILVLGKGEGSAMIRGEVGLRNTGRLRRVAVVTDSAGIATNARAVAIGRDELKRRSALLTIGDVEIDSTHELAPMGSFNVGDDILVQADVPYHGEVSLWHRIIGYTWSPDTERVTVQLRRSEQFEYGSGGTSGV